MRKANRTKHTTICALLFALGAAFWSCPKLMEAQQNTVETYTGSFYLSAYIDIDSGYNAYGISVMQGNFGEESDLIGVYGYLYEGTSLLAYDSSTGYHHVQAGFSAGSPVAPGHNYAVQTDGYVCSTYGEYDEECYGVEYVASAYASVYVYPPPPIIDQMTPSSANQGDQGTLTITGRYLIQNSPDQLVLNFSGPYNPFTLVSSPSTCNPSCTATYSYDLTNYPTNLYQLSVTNNEASSDNVSFTVLPAWPADPCAVGSSPKTQYSSFAPTGAGGDSGSVTVSFSGAAYSAVSLTVPYGPYSTPSSIAAHIAAQITVNYFNSGLTARAFGPNVVYNGDSTIGTVNHAVTGTSFTTTVSSSAESAAGMACMLVAPSPSNPANPCFGANPAELGYGDVGTDGQTIRQHIINNHILENTGVGRSRSKYGVIPLFIPLPISVNHRFVQVQGFNSLTLLLGHTVPDLDPTKIILEYTVPPYDIGPITLSGIGRNQAGQEVATNHLVLTQSCRIVTSYPVNP